MAQFKEPSKSRNRFGASSSSNHQRRGRNDWNTPQILHHNNGNVSIIHTPQSLRNAKQSHINQMNGYQQQSGNNRLYQQQQLKQYQQQKQQRLLNMQNNQQQQPINNRLYQQNQQNQHQQPKSNRLYQQNQPFLKD